MQNINLEDYKGVYVFAQQVDNELSSIAFELLGEAGRLAKPLNTEVTAVLLGSNVGNLVDQLAEYGAVGGKSSGSGKKKTIRNVHKKK